MYGAAVAAPGSARGRGARSVPFNLSSGLGQVRRNRKSALIDQHLTTSPTIAHFNVIGPHKALLLCVIPAPKASRRGVGASAARGVGQRRPKIAAGQGGMEICRCLSALPV